MSKSNPVHPWRLGRTRALIFTQKSLNRAKTGVPHGTPKNFPRLGRDVSTMRKTQSTKINRKINFILHGLATRRLSVKKKSDTKQPFFPPCRNWPIYMHTRPHTNTNIHTTLLQCSPLNSVAEWKWKKSKNLQFRTHFCWNCNSFFLVHGNGSYGHILTVFRIFQNTGTPWKR